jgi:hypothetical protein
MAEKRKVWRVKDTSGALEQVLVETSAEQVTLADTANKFTSTNVEGALAEVMQVAQTGGVTGVKGDAETAYRKGNVNITKANIGLGNVDNTADANKSVASAVKATQDGDGNVIKNTYATKTELNGKLDKTGGTITGSLSVNGGVTVGGNLTVSGTTTTIDSTTLQVKDKLIEVAHGNTTKLTSPAGLVVPKYDGTNSGALVFDGDGMAQVGKVVLNTAGNIDTTKSGLQTLATRTNLVGGNLVQYDSTNKTLVDSKKKVGDLVTTNTEQTITSKKTFSGSIVVDSITTSNNLNVFFNGADKELIYGSPSGKITLTGSADRPTYELDDGTRKDIALVSDVQGTKVDNAKYADSAGYVKNEMVFQGVGYNADANYSNFVRYNGSAARSIKFYKYDFQMQDALGSGNAELSLRSTGVNQGSYSAVTVDTKGRVTAGGKSIEWGTSGQTAPSDDLMVGGLFFQLQ